MPEDVSVVGFDDANVASLASPGLTTVRETTAPVTPPSRPARADR